MIKNLVLFMAALRNPAPESRQITKLVQYLLMFFGGEPRGLHELIGRQFSFVAGNWETLGQLWLDDLVATCWRLHIRHAPPRPRLG